jgi:benzoyl-CoA reductase/2-hydroxyglutaryl-CoA dehydratase subunit BcrC/BadD/HgdB
MDAIMNQFFDAATAVNSAPVRSWKENGGKIVGYTCSYVPGEIFHAAGILPYRLRGIETGSMEIGDAYFGPFICTFPKCILQLAGKGKYAFLDGAIITPGCDSMRRLGECWRKAGDAHPGIVPDFFYYFDVPHKTTEHGLKWFREEIRHLIDALETQFQVKITEDKLRASIAEFNKGRKLLSELETLRAGREIVISGTEAYAVAMAGTVMPRDAFTRCLESLVHSLKKKKGPALDDRKRLMLIGSISDDISLVQLLEEDNKAVVVSENLCFGVREESAMVDETKDPVEALADAYLGESKCPRMYGKYKERLTELERIIKKSGVEGVVMQNIRFCDLHGSRSEERRVGKECRRLCRSRWSPYH